MIKNGIIQTGGKIEVRNNLKIGDVTEINVNSDSPNDINSIMEELAAFIDDNQDIKNVIMGNNINIDVGRDLNIGDTTATNNM